MKRQFCLHTMGKSCSKLELEQKHNPQGKHCHRFHEFPPEITEGLTRVFVVRGAQPLPGWGHLWGSHFGVCRCLQQGLELQEPLCLHQPWSSLHVRHTKVSRLALGCRRSTARPLLQAGTVQGWCKAHRGNKGFCVAHFITCRRKKFCHFLSMLFKIIFIS